MGHTYEKPSYVKVEQAKKNKRITDAEMGEAIVSGRCPELRIIKEIVAKQPLPYQGKIGGVQITGGKVERTYRAIIQSMGCVGSSRPILSYLEFTMTTLGHIWSADARRPALVSI